MPDADLREGDPRFAWWLQTWDARRNMEQALAALNALEAGAAMSAPTSNALEIMDAEFAHDLTYRIEVEIARRDGEIERLRAQVERLLPIVCRVGISEHFTDDGLCVFCEGEDIGQHDEDCTYVVARAALDALEAGGGQAAAGEEGLPPWQVKVLSAIGAGEPCDGMVSAGRMQELANRGLIRWMREDCTDVVYPVLTDIGREALRQAREQEARGGNAG